MTASTTEVQKQKYSEELAAYTLRQWNVLRQSMDSDSSSDIIRNNPVTSPTPPDEAKAPQSEAKDSKSNTRPGQTTISTLQPAPTTDEKPDFLFLLPCRADTQTTPDASPQRYAHSYPKFGSRGENHSSNMREVSVA